MNSLGGIRKANFSARMLSVISLAGSHGIRRRWFVTFSSALSGWDLAPKGSMYVL